MLVYTMEQSINLEESTELGVRSSRIYFATVETKVDLHFGLHPNLIWGTFGALFPRKNRPSHTPYSVHTGNRAC
jgi:hypothetical protein